LTWNAVNSRDYPVILGVFLIFAAMMISINILMDVIYAMIDPRISYER
jgi:peptide/nickel transport system permease protein